MTRNSGLPSGGSFIILYLGSVTFNLESTSIIIGIFDEAIQEVK